MKKLFLNADVILDVSIEREMDIKDSVKLMNLIENGVYQGYTSSIIFSNIYYIQRKLVGHEITINFLKKLRSLLTVLDVDDVIIKKSLDSGFNNFEDAVQHYTALENEIYYIITRNTNDYKKSIIPVYTPTEMLGNS